jgi:hypothetical protein
MGVPSAFMVLQVCRIATEGWGGLSYKVGVEEGPLLRESIMMGSGQTRR